MRGVHGHMPGWWEGGRWGRFGLGCCRTTPKRSRSSASFADAAAAAPPPPARHVEQGLSRGGIRGRAGVGHVQQGDGPEREETAGAQGLTSQAKGVGQSAAHRYSAARGWACAQRWQGPAPGAQGFWSGQSVAHRRSYRRSAARGGARCWRGPPGWSQG
eukprot:6464368-Prymnesium_polylepis.1